jgi:hypothetical protein
MTVISFEEFENGVDMVRAAGAAADGPEYGFCRGEWQERRIWDWQRHVWRTVRVATVGGKPICDNRLPRLPEGDIANTPIDKLLLVCRWLEAEGPKSSREITDKFSTESEFCAKALEYGIFTRRREGPRVLYSAVEGWEDVYAEVQASAGRNKLRGDTARLFDVIKANPGITRRELAERMGITSRSVRNREKTLFRYEVMRKEGEGIDCRYWPV